MREVPQSPLYRSSRPGYPWESISRAEVVFAADPWKAAGLEATTCLLSEYQLGYYGERLYRAAGFAVAHIPVEEDKSHYLST